jgi:energy-coupling factor transporter ATP-binding protein EcfA2
MLTFRSLTLSHVAGVTHAHLEFPDSGVLVVHGPNEVGKSTLLRAIRLLLDDTPTSSRKREVKALKDVSVDEPTTISADLTVGDVELHLTKAFNKGSGRCELRVTAPRAESLTGREASDRFAEIMRGEVDTDLLDALTVEQGASLDQLAAAGLGPLERALSGSPGRKRAMARATAPWPTTGTPEGAAALVDRITAERAPVLSRRAASRRRSSRRLSTRALLPLRDEHAEAERAYDQAQSLIIELERLRAEKEAVSQQGTAGTREEAKAAAVEVEKGKGTPAEGSTNAPTALTGARQTLELAEQRLQVREGPGLGARRRRGGEASVPQPRPSAAAEAAEGARQEESRLRADLARVRRQARATTAFIRYLDAVQRRDELSATLRTTQEQQVEAVRVAREISEVRERIDENPVTAEVAAAVDRASAELTRAQGIRDASATLVELSGRVGGRFTLDGEEHELDEAAHHLRVTSRRTLQLGDFSLTITPAQGTGSGEQADDLAQDVDRAEKQLQAALADAGVEDVGDVTQKAGQRRLSEEQLAELRITLSQATEWAQPGGTGPLHHGAHPGGPPGRTGGRHCKGPVRGRGPGRGRRPAGPRRL